MKLSTIINITSLRTAGLTLLLAVAAAPALTSCDGDVFNIGADPFKDQTYLAPDSLLPLSSYLDTQERFTELTRALRYADLYNALNMRAKGTSFTLFAPTNEAMQEFYQRRGVASLEELDPDYVRALILTHTLKDSITASKFVLQTSVKNLDGETLPVQMDSVHAGQALLGEDVPVTEFGISAGNGTVYVVGKCLSPLVETLYERVAEAGDSRIMQQALEATPWAKKLDVVADTTYELGAMKINKYSYTLLNVSDQVFARSGINSLADLQKKLTANDRRSLSPDSLLLEYVGYHILKAKYSPKALAPSAVGGTRMWDTQASNQVLTTSLPVGAATSDAVIFNPASPDAAAFDLGRSNVNAKNGYLHYLTSWMPVWEPEQTTVIWDLGDDASIRGMVDAEYYQPSIVPTTETRTRVATAKCFTFQVGEGGSKNNKFSDIDYMTSKLYSKVRKDASGATVKDQDGKIVKDTIYARNNDKLVFNVGYMGSVEMPTPTLVRGKYKVELALVFTANHVFMRNQTDGNGGLLRLSFDGREDYTVFTAPYTMVPETLPYIYIVTLYDEIEFAQTSSHQFRMVVLDPAASSNGNFSLQFDYIKFTPIE